MNIEPLEDRIAPAAAFINPTTATYTDVDGDLVTVKFSKPVLTATNVAADFTMSSAGGVFGGQHLDELFIKSEPTFEGVSISITARPQDANGDHVVDGDGLVNVGEITAWQIFDTGIRLGTVMVDGDLSGLGAGADGTGIALKKLSVVSLGRFQTGGASVLGNGGIGSITATADVSGSINAIGGQLGAVTIGGSLVDGSQIIANGIGAVKIGVDCAGDLVADNGKIASVTIGRSLVGGGTTGKIVSKGDLGAVKIGRDIIGAGQNGAPTGFVKSEGNIASVTLGGSLLGGLADGTVPNGSSGGIFATGDVGAVKIGGAVFGGGGESSAVINAIFGKLASLTVGQSVVGGAGEGSARIYASSVGPVKIGGDLEAGTAVNGSGTISSAGGVASVSLGGSLVAPAGTKGATISSSGTKTITILGDVKGGNMTESARIFVEGDLGMLTIAGSLLGGTAADTGTITVGGTVGKLTIGGDVRGGSLAPGGSTYSESGSIYVRHLTSGVIGGSVIAGTDASNSGELDLNASIGALTSIDSLTIRGNVSGSVGSGGANTVKIYALSQFNGAVGAKDVAIGKLTVFGRLERTDILAGYARLENGAAITLAASNADAQIDTVTVSGDWIASNLIAGVQANGDGFGTANDGKATGVPTIDLKDDDDATGAISKINKVIIKGTAIGTLSATDTQVFAIEAQQIGSITLGRGVKEPLQAGRSNDLFSLRDPLGPTLQTGGTSDFYAFEI